MTQTKKKTIMFLGIAILLLIFFVVAMIGQSAVVASAATLDNATDIKDKINSVMSNGKAPVKESTEGTRIANAADLRAFLETGTGKGYLVYDIMDFSWDSGCFTSRLMSANVSELNGNGHKIGLTATKLSTSPAVSFDNIDDIVSTYAGTKDTTGYIDLHGGLIGYLRPNQVIRNCNFEYKTNNMDTTYKTGNTGTMGLIAAYSRGTIENCSVTINKNITMFSDTSLTGGTGDDHQETMSKHCFALGGFVGTLSTNGRISNSKITLDGNLTLSIQCQNIKNNTFQNEYRDNYARAWTGGVVGWMANGSDVFNIETAGSGNLDARAVNDQKSRSRSFSGIVAGISGGDGVLAQDSLAGKIDTYGRIDGVINNWTGFAKYLVYGGDGTNDTYSPTGDAENSIQYLVVGLAGMKNNGNSNVSNIFMKQDVYSGNTFSIGYDYTISMGTNGKKRGRWYSTNIIMQDVLGQADGSNRHTQASDSHASLKFAGVDISSPVWAIYNLNGVEAVLWSKEVINTTTQASDLEYFYDRATSIEDAKKFDITYTEIPRGQNQNYNIKYTHGRAVYFKKEYPNGSDESNPNKVILPDTQYGTPLSAPKIKVYQDKDCTIHLRDFSDRSYWKSVNDSNNMPVAMPSTAVAAGTYESFIFLENSDGRNHNYIHFLNTSLRYVSYIYDDPNYMAYKETHPDYEPVKKGEKQIEWQQRAVQSVIAKLTQINWGPDTDVKDVGKGTEYDPATGNPITFGRYETEYDGDPVVFNLTIPAGDLVFDTDVCRVNYEYRVLNSYTNEYEVTDSCVNAGKYKVVVTSLSNQDYRLLELAEGSYYCIDFEITKRQIKISDRTGSVISDDGTYYLLETEYQASDINIADNTYVCFSEDDAKSSRAGIVIYNVLDIDTNIIRFDYLSVDGGELDKRNVGEFNMVISLLTGIKSDNYVLPEVYTYLVRIVETDAIFSNCDPVSYAYGNNFRDKVSPVATGKGNDGNLGFIKTNYYKKLEDGTEEALDAAPKNAGEYRAEYSFSYPNYRDTEISIDVTIAKRKVTVTYSDKQYDSFVYGERRITSIPATLDRQRAGSDEGILNQEYKATKPAYRFYMLDANGRRTGQYFDKVEAYGLSGEYEAELVITFDETVELPGGQKVDKDTSPLNYEVENGVYTITVKKRPVTVVLNDVERSYGDDDYQFVGDANNETKRSWDYALDSLHFLEDDDIVIMPYLSNSDRFATVDGEYKVLSDEAHWSGYVDTKTGIKMIDNYDITVIEGVYKVTPRKVKVKVNLNTDNVVYGYELPEVVSITTVGDKDFFEQDNIQLEAFWDDIHQGSNAGTYYVGASIVESEKSKNYELDLEEGEFEILPRILTILSATVDEGNKNVEYLFDGSEKKPIVDITYLEEPYNNDVIDFDYNYFEVKDGVMDTEPTLDPTNAGVYRVYLADVSSPNYTIVFGEDYVRGSVTMTIRKRDISIEVYPGYRIYSIEGSLTPIVRGEIHEEEGWHYFTREEAIANGYGDVINMPYKYAQGEATLDENKFVKNNEELQAQMYIDEYYKELGRHNGVVKLVFNGLVPDPDAIDADGNWLTEQVVGSDGSAIDVIMPKYRNYNINIVPGDLHVLSGDLENVGQYVNLRSKEQVYDGTDKFEDFRVETTNANIINALKFRVFRYVAVSTLPSAEASALAAAYGRYSQSIGENGNFEYTLSAEGDYVRKYVKRIEFGDAVDEGIVNAGQYFQHITPADEKFFTGEFITDFYITKATRDLSSINVKVSVYYNKIVLSCDVEGMLVSFNGAAYVNKTTFDNLTADTEYSVKVKFAESANYFATEDSIDFDLRTGIDITAITDTLNKLNKIDFSNIAEFESKVLMFIDRVSEEDMSFIDQAKLAKLQASYNQLLKGASSVVKGAQEVGAMAVGKSGNSSKTVAKTVALSTGGVGMLLAAGFMVSKRKKEEQEQTVQTKKVKTANFGRISKYAFVMLIIVIVCAVALVGCDGSGEKGFQRADLYKIASYQTDGQNGNRALTIEVKAGELMLYKYDNGQETKHPALDISDMSFGADGMGFEFDDMYFDNIEFKVENDEATFSADIRETLVFLGVDNASNGKVNVTVDVAKKSLNTIDVSYDIVNSSGTYNVSVSVR